MHSTAATRSATRSACPALVRFARLDDHPLPLDLAAVRRGHRQGELLRQQVVARVAGGHADDIAATAQIVDVIPQDDFPHR